MGGDKDRLVALEARHGDTLEGVEGEGVGLRHGTIVDRVGECAMKGLVFVGVVPAGNCDFVDARSC